MAERKPAKPTMRPLTREEVADFLDWVKRGKPAENVGGMRELDRVTARVRGAMRERDAKAHAHRHIARLRRPVH